MVYLALACQLHSLTELAITTASPDRTFSVIPPAIPTPSTYIHPVRSKIPFPCE